MNFAKKTKKELKKLQAQPQPLLRDAPDQSNHYVWGQRSALVTLHSTFIEYGQGGVTLKIIQLQYALFWEILKQAEPDSNIESFRRGRVDVMDKYVGLLEDYRKGKLD
jgi:hypothetical protein